MQLTGLYFSICADMSILTEVYALFRRSHGVSFRGFRQISPHVHAPTLTHLPLRSSSSFFYSTNLGGSKFSQIFKQNCVKYGIDLNRIDGLNLDPLFRDVTDGVLLEYKIFNHLEENPVVGRTTGALVGAFIQSYRGIDKEYKLKLLSYEFNLSLREEVLAQTLEKKKKTVKAEDRRAEEVLAKTLEKKKKTVKAEEDRRVEEVLAQTLKKKKKTVKTEDRKRK